MARKKNWVLTFLYLIIIGVLYTSPAYSQPIPFDKHYSDSILPLLPVMSADSTKVKHLVELARMYFGVNGEKAIAFVIEGETLAKIIGYKNGLINCLRQQAFYYGVTGDWPKASLAINEFEKLAGSEEIFVCNMRWLVSVTKNDTLDALKWALKALHHPEFDSLSEMDTWATYMQVTRAYTSINQLDSAIYYSAYLKKLVSKYGDIIPDLKFVSFEALGELAIKRKEYAEALENFRLCQSGLGLAQTYQKLRQPDSAIYYALKTLNNNNNFQAPGYGIEAARILADEYSMIDPVAALKYQQQLMEKKDKLYSVQKVKQMEAVSLVAQQQAFDLKAKAVADRNKLFKSILFTALFFLSLFIFVLWRNNNSKRITNLKLEQSLKDLEAAQSQLIQAEKMASLGELTAGIAHEIQNPLNFVNNFSDVNQELVVELKEEISRGNILEAEKIADSIRENESKINHHGKRADAIVKNMLQHSRSGNGQLEPTDINALCDEYLRLSYHGLRAKDKSFNATMETDYGLTAGKVKIIPQDIGRVLLNLFNNAFYAVSDKKKRAESDYNPTVSISTRRVNDKVHITVRDNGAGIPANVKEKIFQPFFTTKPTGQGTGLGLSLSYDIITKGHNGRLMVESEEGKGAIFVIQLPTE